MANIQKTNLETSNAKNIIFSIIAIFIVPLIALLLIELSLRLVDVGHSYDFFDEIEINGVPYYQDNKLFANQFYPASLGIAPLNNTLKKERSSDSIRVYILGGSAAQGFPHRNHGVSRHLDAHLRAALPGKKIEIVNTSMTSVNSHVVYEVAKGIPPDSADYAVILMGNNEVVGPYGPSTFSQNFSSNITMIRAIQALKRSRIWQGMATVIQQARPAVDKEEIVWEGMQMFTEFSVPHDDPRLDAVYSHYETNLRDIIAILKDKGMHVVLSSVPVNLRHSAPFGSAHSSKLTEAQSKKWDELNAKAGEALAGQSWGAAITLLEELIAIDPEYADSHFLLATAYERLNQFDLSKTHYNKALDFDTLRFRTNSRLNQIVQNVADSEGNNSFSFVDSLKVFNEVSAPYSPGWDLLHEHVHFDYYGNYVLAREFTRSIMKDMQNSMDYKKLSSTEAAQWIGFPNHETIQVMNRLEDMISQAPFIKQSNAGALLESTQKRKQAIISEVGSPADVIERRKTLVSNGNADWKIHYELAALNKYLGNEDSVKYHYKEIFKLYPYNLESQVDFAEISSREQNFNEAIYYLEQALNYTRGDPEIIVKIHGLLGLNYLKINDYNKGSENLLHITNDYADNIGATLRAYGLLIKSARENGFNNDVNRYVRDVQGYAERLIKQGKDRAYPLLYRRMAQIMSLAGRTNEAKVWQAKKPNKQ